MPEDTRGRTGRVRLTREAVLRRAVAVADADGLPALTMRRLADELGVEAMSLYHHVAGKDALLDGIADLVFAEVLEAASTGPGADAVRQGSVRWDAAVRTRILAARTVMLRHPWAPLVIASRPAIGFAASRHVDALVGLMRTGGLSHDLIHHGLHALGSRLYGFTQEVGEPDPSAAEARAAARVMIDRLPNLAAMLEAVAHDDPGSTLGWCDDQTEFEFALDVLLEGLQRRASGA
ncbi:TetR/AcrR family transcriptional regulator [Actinotalea fermentans]|uniref:TetR/AcrR family transcriptional regulator n=1 Tax=Actinotalea fermentans TaxID=43671 RepID=UPI00054F4459|nr:TetR/AcrR family transcriptional regulator C-terminal domain-containing protein [Actinotalea fermentans]